MQRSRLRNIINKANNLKNETPFERFKNSLPEELDYYKGDNYRLKAAWEAYGKPNNIQEAYWEGLIRPIGENKYTMPSIGYNEETEDYEYLNTGKENETVSKDIRAWDNDVIPFIQELKQGGYVRTFNEEKDCWTYTKNSQKREEPIENNEQQVNNIEAFKQGGQMNLIPDGALHARKNNMELAKEGEVTHKGIPVVDQEGEQQAEIEREEIIFSKSTTETIEEAYKKFYQEETSEAEKEKLAIKIGKFLTYQILNNTDDKTGLIDKINSQ